MTVMPTPSINPFATNRVRPGAIDYWFPAGTTCEQLVERLRENAWWGQIIGPHGSGKSTLLHTLRPALEQNGRQLREFTLRQGQRQLPADAWRGTISRTTLIVVDGFEQLGWWSRRRLQSACRRSDCGLLVTAHRNVGLPELFRVVPSPETARHLVAELLRENDPRLLSQNEVTQCFERHGGNLREMLFALYDLYELRRRDGQVAQSSIAGTNI